MLHVVLQKRSPNACPIPKVKVKSSPMIEKLQVGPGRTHILPQQIKTGWHWSWSQLLCGRAATGKGDAGTRGDSQVNRAVASLVRGPSPTILKEEGRAGLVMVTTSSPVIPRCVPKHVSAWIRIVLRGWAWAWQQHCSSREQGQEPQFKCSS